MDEHKLTEQMSQYSEERILFKKQRVTERKKSLEGIRISSIYNTATKKARIEVAVYRLYFIHEDS